MKNFILWTLIDKIRRETGMTVFLTTHYLEEAEKATDVVIMDKGNIIAHGTPNELKNLYSSDSLYAYMAQSEEFENKLSKMPYKYNYDAERGAYRICVGGTPATKKLISELDSYLTDIEFVKGNMDDVFLNVTGKDIKLTEEGEDD